MCELNERNVVRDTDLVLMMTPRERLMVLRLFPLLRDLVRGDDGED